MNSLNVEICKAKKEDFSYIRQKIKNYLLDSKNVHWAEFFVARIEERVVSFGRILDYGEFFEIASLGVDYYYRKKGIGKKMLSFLIREARRLNSRKPIYGVTHLPEFAASCGFIEVQKDYPRQMDYKRKHCCHLDKSRIKIIKWNG